MTKSKQRLHIRSIIGAYTDLQEDIDKQQQHWHLSYWLSPGKRSANQRMPATLSYNSANYLFNINTNMTQELSSVRAAHLCIFYLGVWSAATYPRYHKAFEELNLCFVWSDGLNWVSVGGRSVPNLIWTIWTFTWFVVGFHTHWIKSKRASEQERNLPSCEWQ